MVGMCICTGMALVWWGIERPSQYIANAAAMMANRNTIIQPTILKSMPKINELRGCNADAAPAEPARTLHA